MMRRAQGFEQLRIAPDRPALMDLSRRLGQTDDRPRAALKEVRVRAVGLWIVAALQVAFAAPGITLRSGLIGRIRIEPPAAGEVSLIHRSIPLLLSGSFEYRL